MCLVQAFYNLSARVCPRILRAGQQECDIEFWIAMISFQPAMEITGTQLGYHGNRWPWHNPPQCSLTCRKRFCSLGCGHNCVKWGLHNMHSCSCSSLLSTAWRVSLWECDTSLWKNYKEHLRVPQSFTHMHSIKRSVLFLWITTDREILHAQALISYLKFLFSFILPQIKGAFGPLTVERVCLGTIEAC